jgi:hypothetical protein
MEALKVNNRINKPTTWISPNDWTQPMEEPTRIAPCTDTHGVSSEGVVFLQGQNVTDQHGVKELMVSFDPAAIERKFAIRHLNEQLEGRTVKSDTYPGKKASR